MSLAWEVREVGGRGRAGVARSKIAKGDIVIEEEAVCHVVKGDVRYGCCQYCSKISIYWLPSSSISRGLPT